MAFNPDVLCFWLFLPSRGAGGFSGSGRPANRAKIPKVFGEIITPAPSKESFQNPEIIHLLGAMNTADRRIKPLGRARRRRFACLCG